MGGKDIFGFDLSEINNINEELVIELMEKILNADKTICRCHLCIEDIYALSLNNLPPLYVQSTFKETTFQDNRLTRILDRAKVEKAVREATSRVNSNPYH